LLAAIHFGDRINFRTCREQEAGDVNGVAGRLLAFLFDSVGGDVVEQGGVVGAGGLGVNKFGSFA